MLYFNRIYNYLSRNAWWFLNFRTFKNLGSGSYVFKPLRIDGAKNIYIGSKVYIGYRTWLAAVTKNIETSSELVIGDGSCIGNFNHFYSTKSIRIGKNVLTADKVYISDNLHGYEDIRIPIMNQSIKQISTVEIGDGSWIGENVCVIGVKIGKNCVIGANAVVTKDIPDYCVAVGAPAKIIKKYNQILCVWEKV